VGTGRRGRESEKRLFKREEERGKEEEPCGLLVWHGEMRLKKKEEEKRRELTDTKNDWAAWDLRVKEEFKFKVEKCPVIFSLSLYIFILIINRFFKCNNR
jgi:hypothetical protein